LAEPDASGDSEGASPLDAVFEKAVRPFASGAELKKEIPPETPFVIMTKGEKLPSEKRELDGGLTLNVPILAALKDAKLATWHRVGDFDFDALEPDAMGMLILHDGAKPLEVRVVTRAAGGALLVADLDAMFDGVKALAGNPIFKGFPGAEFIVDALASGLGAAKADLVKSLTTPDSTGRSLMQQFGDAASASKGPKTAGRPRKGRL